ncbi:MAG: metal-dependent hydrolase [Longimicrobiales bacterium]
MASISHLAAGALCGAIYARRTGTRPLPAVVGFAALGLSPDLDFIALEMGLDHTPLGHRVLTHSLTFSVIAGVAIGAVVAPRAWRALACVLCVAALASHGLLDALTANGPGPRLLWPFSSQPLQFGWHPLPGTRSYQEYFTPAAIPVFVGEALWNIPLLVGTAWLLLRPGRAHGAGGSPSHE